MPIYVAILLLVTLVWGATFPIIKMATAHLSGVEVSALRFLVAAVVVVPWAVRARVQTWRDGGILGVVALVSYVAQAYGLEFISSNRSAFLTSLNVLMVPLLGVVLGVRLTPTTLLAACIACAGIGLMSWDGGAHAIGDAATILAALAYALYVVMLSRRATHHRPAELAATQIIWMALIGAVWLAIQSSDINGTPSVLTRLHDREILSIAFLGIVATAGMLYLQALAQRHVSANKAALVYAMEPVFAAILGWAILGETMSLQAILGGVMVVAAIVYSEWHQNQRPSRA